MQDLKIEGIGTIAGGEYGNVLTDGVVTCIGDLKAEKIRSEGIFTCKGSIVADRLDCDGMATVKGILKAKQICIDGMLTVSDDMKIEATEILCDGFIKLNGQISADRIDADGNIDALEIVGGQISIQSNYRKFFLTCRSRIEKIEGTTVDLRYVEAKSVNGKDLTIGNGCRVESINCTGTLKVARGARVGTVTGQHTRVDF